MDRDTFQRVLKKSVDGGIPVTSVLENIYDEMVEDMLAA